jgi:hypothetical protein
MTPYAFRPMNDEDAREIAGWRYDPPYDFYGATSDPDGFRLSVATFNERAGFGRGEVFMHHTNGGDHPFLLMTRGA